MNDLLVNEIFGKTIQGEGPSAGIPATFLRLAGCNLACSFCDTPYTFNWKGTPFAHTEKFDKAQEARWMSFKEVSEALSVVTGRNAILVITGGEPLLQQVRLIPFLEAWLKPDYLWIEIETNGTIKPDKELCKMSMVKFNCSPKLSSSGKDNTLMKRIVSSALAELSMQGAIFKFVITDDKDMAEVMQLKNSYGISSRDIYLMPEGKTQEELATRQKFVVEKCIEYGFNYSPRLHVSLWGTRRKV